MENMKKLKEMKIYEEKLCRNIAEICQYAPAYTIDYLYTIVD